MASGPEHYEEAEQLLAAAADTDMGSDLERYRLAAAQVHATLALAAATALNDPDPNGDGMREKDYRAWIKVAGEE
ncbi:MULTISPECIES: hypothetical protein [unclassified Streptomyces]|uniref:hypothetical protein n=1 Tax=unclassified Streptomyces TaxID=2593676 RepID=UPI00093C1545|nr:hypothetical protein [Streptomyces sp. CB01883]OKJ86972.1 hypothetical protein AMK32_06890 [Streptomyces sp. CB01883]